MKKLIYLIMAAGFIFTACNPMDDIFSEIDAQENTVVGDAVITLTDADYDELGLTYGSFSSLDDAKSKLPNYLSDLYPVWGKGSSVLVGYKLYVGNEPGVSAYTGALNYTLANIDYPGSGDNAIGFYPNENSDDFLGDILTAKISSPVEGQNVLVKYKQYIGEPILGVSNYFDADFKTAGTLLDFDAVSVVGDQVWVETSGYGAKMTGYASGAKPNEDWLISQEINLISQTNISFQVNQALNYASGQLNLVNILVSANYTGDVATATWDTVNLTTKPAGTNWTFITSEDYDFSAYEGKKIHIAFKYESTATVASTWEIARAVIKTPGVEGETVTKQLYYTYKNGNWIIAKGAYYLNAADFDSMGEAAGQPGQYNNFSSSILPDNYLPKFLSIKYPYALEGDQLYITYPYYSSSTGAQTRGNLYTVINGEWTAYQSTIDTTLQFAHDGSTWVPDNTIKYEFVGADYDYIKTTFANVDGYATAVANLSSYGNISTFNWTPAQIDAAIGAVLMHNYPGMAEGQKFAATIYVYDGSSHNLTINYILSGGVYVRN